MKKFLLSALALLLFFMSACSLNDNSVNSEPKEARIIDSGKYYRVYKGDTTQVCYDIYNSNGEIVLSEKTERPLEIHMINDDVIDIKIGMGTGLAIHKYYSASKNVFSQEFSYVLANSNELTAYIGIPEENSFKNRKVIVQNVFDEKLFYKEFKLDFSNVDTPVIEAEFVNNGNSLQLTYISGEEQTQISSTLDLI